jgi:MFS family permease
MSTETGLRSIIKGNLGVMLLSAGLWNIAGQMTWGFFSLYVLALGGSYFDVGIISAVGSIASILPTFFGGYLADRLGRKWMVYSMSFLIAFTELIRAFAPEYSWLIVAAILGSIFHGLRDPSFQSIIMDSTDPQNRAVGYALWTVVPSLFGVFSPYVIGVLIDQHGTQVAMRWAYLAVFAAGMLSSFIRYRYLDETLTEGNKKDVKLRSAVNELLSDFKFTLRYLPRQLWIFLVTDMFFTLGWAICDPYYVTYATEVVHLTGAQWGLVMTSWTIINTLLRLPAARASDKYGRVVFMFPAMFMWAICFFTFIYTRSFAQVLIVRGVLAISSSVGDPAWLAMFGDYSPREHRGRFNAIRSVLWSVIWGFGNVLGGFLYQSFSKQSPFIVGAGIQFIMALVALKFIKEPEMRQE